MHLSLSFSGNEYMTCLIYNLTYSYVRFILKNSPPPIISSVHVISIYIFKLFVASV